MGNEPNQKEKEELEKLEQAGSFHLKLLLLMILSFGFVFIVPEKYSVIPGIIAAVLLIAFGVSHFNMQYFQRCPRCSTRINTAGSTCDNCLLLLSSNKQKGDGSEWYK